jgi:hypothetical protein
MSRQRNFSGQKKPFSKIVIALVLLCVLILAVLFLFLLVRALRKRLPPPPTGVTTPTASPAPARRGAFPELAVKPPPLNEPFKGCPPEGDGGDPALNILKNRIDEGNYLPVEFDAVKNLPWPKAVERRDRNRWSSMDAAEVARYEGTPVIIEGYLFDAKLMGPESCNCHGADNEFRDFHVWLTKQAGEDRMNSIVVETTPHLRARHPGWTTAALKKIARNKQRVRISGWLLLDPEHPDQVGKTRATIWELHPIMKIEAEQDSGWIALD